ncbi:MAG: hypothetical protein M3552_00525 [Planctomycetota bacterium]|nr:hypothetical protein [Planctomycetaceae bacterium]MDQ3329130.1 hypothetical protein [Planctomycetota bacterium]
MTSPALEPIRRALEAAGPAAAAEALVETLRERGDYDRLFDALLIRARVKLGVPTVKPTSFADVPDDKQAAFEEAYLAAAREVGKLLLDSGSLARAWAYFRTIREPQPVADALAAIDPTNLDYDRTNELIEIALHDGANRVAGLRILLASHGTCNTVTMTDQVLPMMTPDERRQTAAMLVRDVYDALAANLKRDVESRLAGITAPDSIQELIADRGFLFENANYHIDVSHLHSTVRFARALTPADPELALAIELAEYGSKLDRQFRYPADPPFDEYYEAHLAYLKAVADVDREASLGYFRDRLDKETDERDRQIIAYVLVDLLTRCEELNEAAKVAARHLADLEEPGGFSFSSLCGKAGRIDLLRGAAEKADDPVRYAAAVITERGQGSGGGGQGKNADG